MRMQYAEALLAAQKQQRPNEPAGQAAHLVVVDLVELLPGEQPGLLILVELWDIQVLGLYEAQR